MKKKSINKTVTLTLLFAGLITMCFCSVPRAEETPAVVPGAVEVRMQELHSAAAELSAEFDVIVSEFSTDPSFLENEMARLSVLQNKLGSLYQETAQADNECGYILNQSILSATRCASQVISCLLYIHKQTKPTILNPNGGMPANPIKYLKIVLHVAKAAIAAGKSAVNAILYFVQYPVCLMSNG